MTAATETRSPPEALDTLSGRLSAVRRQTFRPPPRLTVPEWADRYRHLASAAGNLSGKFSTSRVEAARGPMMAVTEPGVRTITVMSCTQLMKSTLLENVFGYFAHLDPCPMLLVQPKEDAAEAFAKERIEPMLNATPALRRLVGNRKTRSSESTVTFKSFPGGFLALVGAGSPTNLAARPIRVVLQDEIDKYETSKEGDPIALAEERMETYETNSLALRVCSPTLEETSRIARSYADSDQRRAWVACPHCVHQQCLDFFRHVHWSKDAAGEHLPETAAIHCEACGAAWSEAERRFALAGIRWFQTRSFTCCGERQDPMATRSWRWDARHLVGRATCLHCGGDAVDNAHAGYQASKLLSPRGTVVRLATRWLAAEHDPDLRQTYFNTQLGLPVKFAYGRDVSVDGLMARRETFEAEVPDGVLVLTAGIDVQSGDGGRFEIEIIGWGLGEESWSIGYETIEGDLEQSDVWSRLDALLLRDWRRGDGSTIRIAAACIDSGGHHTQAVYAFSRARLGRRVWAIKGAAERGGQRQPVWGAKKIDARKYRRGFRPILIGVNAAKDRISGRLGIETPGPGYCHVPADREQAWFDQITAEKLTSIRRGGTRINVWLLPQGRRNEALDARVYGYAALMGWLHQGRSLEAEARRRAGATRQKRPGPVAPVLPGMPAQPVPAPAPPAPPRPQADVAPPRQRRGRTVVRSTYLMR